MTGLRFFVTCAKGTEGPLRRELCDLGIRGPRGAQGGVSFEGSFDDGMRACLWSRVGMRVLMEVGAFLAADADGLYAGARSIDWKPWLTPKQTLAVSATVNNSQTLTHTGFAALKVKDAVVDAIRDRTGTRPNVNTDNPDVSIVLYVDGTAARLYLDLAGDPLHRRAYRVAMTEAPLKESLAASVLVLSGISGRLPPNPRAREIPLDDDDESRATPFFDPMCGSGTLAIEQAMRARRLAPGRNRRFGFERWPDQDFESAWRKLRDEARDVALRESPSKIFARDVDPASIEAARKNAHAAGVGGDITFAVADARLGKAPTSSGWIVSNPPYGERLGDGDDAALERLQRDLAAAWTRMPGWRLCVLTAGPRLMDLMGRKPRIMHRLWNGNLEVRLLAFDPITSAAARD